jgi:hypothetical protein
MNRVCPKCGSLKEDHVRNGYFIRTFDKALVQRYRCRSCKKEFSDSTFQLRYRQRLRSVNGLIEKELISGSSLRRIALILNLNYKTVVRKFFYLGLKARKYNEKRLKDLDSVKEIQFDDMETFEHTKLKPISITVAVVKKKRFLLGAEVSSMPAKGLLAEKSRKKYGPREDNRKKAREVLFNKIKPITTGNTVFESDENPHYFKHYKEHFPNCEYHQYKGRRGCVVGQGELKATGRDPLFSLNHTCAMIRYAISRLVRRTWVTTKKLEALQNHLDIYISYHNRVLIN